MLTELKKALEKRDLAWKKSRQEYDKVLNDFKNKIPEILPYKDKYIKIYNKFIKVESLFLYGNKIHIRGYGFYGNNEGCSESNCFTIDGSMFYEFDVYEIETVVKNIEIIDKSEFDKQFYYLINYMQKEHLNQ
jgi:hypothetical protein